MSDSTEVPFPKDPVCTFVEKPKGRGGAKGYSRIWFRDPKYGGLSTVFVHAGPDLHDDELDATVWHYDKGDGVITISPSIHAIGRYHTTNPVTFRLVETIDELGLP